MTYVSNIILGDDSTAISSLALCEAELLQVAGVE